MDYEQAYNKALERAKSAIKECGDNKGCISMIESIFPELSESEDERIRKAIKYCIKQGFIGCGKIDNVTPDECLAWLEKQGTPAKLSEEEQNKFAKGVLSSCALSFINYLDAHKYESKMCVSNGECEDIENSFLNAMWDRLHRYYCKYIEKQGEQKPVESPKDYNDIDPHYGIPVEDLMSKEKTAEKEEPKFHEGDWIIHQGTENIYQVVAIIDNQYQLKNGDNYTIQNCADVDRCARLWNIEKKKLKKLTQSVTKISEQVSWSEEDVRNMNDIDYILFYDKDLSEETCMRLRNWIESLKERMGGK